MAIGYNTILYPILSIKGSVMDDYLEVYANFTEWFENHPLGLAKKTVKQYLFIVKSLANFLRLFQVRALNDLSQDTFSKFIHLKPNKERYSASSVIQRIAALDIFFSWAIENKWIRENNNPVVYYKKMKIQPRLFDDALHTKNITANILTPQEQQKLINCGEIKDLSSARNNCIFLLTIATGLYVEEVSTLQKNAVNLHRGYLLINKGGDNERRVDIDLTICEKACKEWGNYRKEIPGEVTNPLYFLNRNGKQIEPNRLYEIVSKILTKNGIKKNQMGPDLLRQTAIFNMLKNGSTVEEVKKATGITTSAQIEKYMPFI